MIRVPSLVVAFVTAVVAPKAAPPADPPADAGIPSGGRERIESIALAGSGKAGTVVTTPVLLGGDATAYEFGRGACKRLDPAVVEQLFVAMRSRAAVTIDATDGAGTRCLTSVTFFAPQT